MAQPHPAQSGGDEREKTVDGEFSAPVAELVPERLLGAERGELKAGSQDEIESGETFGRRGESGARYAPCDDRDYAWTQQVINSLKLILADRPI